MKIDKFLKAALVGLTLGIATAPPWARRPKHFASCVAKQPQHCRFR